MRRRPHSNDIIDLADLRAIAQDADLLDRLAAGEPTADPTVALLATLREESTRRNPAVSAADLVPAPAGDGVPRRPARRARWRAAIVLAVTAAVPSTGVAAAAAHPGSPLYAIHRAILGPTADDAAVPAHLLDRAEDEARAAENDGGPHAASHVAAGWDLVAKARRHLSALHAADASTLADRADRVAWRLGAMSRAATTVGATPVSRVTVTPSGCERGHPRAAVATLPTVHMHPAGRPRPHHRHHGAARGALAAELDRDADCA